MIIYLQPGVITGRRAFSRERDFFCHGVVIVTLSILPLVVRKTKPCLQVVLGAQKQRSFPTVNERKKSIVHIILAFPCSKVELSAMPTYSYSIIESDCHKVVDAVHINFGIIKYVIIILHSITNYKGIY